MLSLAAWIFSYVRITSLAHVGKTIWGIDSLSGVFTLYHDDFERGGSKKWSLELTPFSPEDNRFEFPPGAEPAAPSVTCSDRCATIVSLWSG